jgi:hypothetical protein
MNGIWPRKGCGCGRKGARTKQVHQHAMCPRAFGPGGRRQNPLYSAGSDGQSDSGPHASIPSASGSIRPPRLCRAAARAAHLRRRAARPGAGRRHHGPHPAPGSNAQIQRRRPQVRCPGPFSHPAAVKAGDGVFRTRDFNSKSYRTRDFATKPAATKDFDKTGKTYAVRAVAVNEDRAAGKTMDTHGYVPAGKPYLERGKRQDTIDEIPDAKKMTIDQVRELLNKPK